MYGLFCQRLGLGRTLFRELGICRSAGRLLPFGVGFISSDVGGDRRRKEHKPIDVEACQAYLVNSCGLSPKDAENVSRARGPLKPERANGVLKILRDHGLDDTQVSKLVKRNPQVIFSDAEKTILPKVQFFSSIGMTSKDLACLVTGNPVLLTKSLEKSLVPRFEFLKTILVDNDGVIKAMKKNSWIFLADADRNLAPNLSALRKAGVPQHALRGTMQHFAAVVIQSREKFGKCFDEVIKMGFHPTESAFIRAMHVLSSTLEAGRDRKMNILRRCGMNEIEIQSAFKRCPHVLLVSDKKLMRNMEFLVKDMHWSPSDIVRYPLALHLSLENRLKPRCSVMRLLQSKGLVGKDLRLSVFLSITGNAFYVKYVVGHIGKFPQLLDVYQGKMSSLDLIDMTQQGC